MHKPHSSLEKPHSQYRFAALKSRMGFSLVEVTLAIAIIATAFIALLGLIPAGLQIFRTTVDATNITRITTHVTTMLQATEYLKLADLNTAYPLFYTMRMAVFLIATQRWLPPMRKTVCMLHVW